MAVRMLNKHLEDVPAAAGCVGRMFAAWGQLQDEAGMREILGTKERARGVWELGRGKPSGRAGTFLVRGES